MRMPLLLLVLPVLLALPGPGHALTFTRTWAPLVDCAPYGAIAVAPFLSDGVRGLEGTTVARQVADAIQAEGVVPAQYVPRLPGRGAEADPAPALAAAGALGAGVVLLGTVSTETRLDYGTVPVQREHLIWREITDDQGRRRRIEEREWRTVYVRTETRTVWVELRASAYAVSNGAYLGQAEVSDRASDYWQEDTGGWAARSPEVLIRRLMPKLVEGLARSFTPWREELNRGFRPERNRSVLDREAIAAAEAGDFQTAIGLFEQALPDNPRGAADIYGNLALIYEAMGDPHQALAMVDLGLSVPIQGGHNLRQMRQDLERIWQGAVLPAAAPAGPVYDQPMPVEQTYDLTHRRVHVVRIEEGRLFIDAGELDGWQTGDKVSLVRRMIVADLDGRPLGDYIEHLGSAQIIEVFDRFSVAEVLWMMDGAEPAAGLGVLRDPKTETGEE